MGKSSSSTPKQVSPYDAATQQYKAMEEFMPKSAQLQWDILNNPTYGTRAQTGLNESIRQELYPNETAIRNQYVQNVLASLQSPQGISPEQQALQGQARMSAQGELQKAMRDRANLGGGLYGGRAVAQEGKAVGQLQQGFAETDINRDIQARQQALSATLPILSLLYPDVNITPPQFTSPVASADTAYSTLANQRNTDLQYQAQQQANQNALWQSLFSGVGTAAGGYMGGTAFDNFLTPTKKGT